MICSGLTGVYRVEKVCSLLLLFDICVDEEGISLGMDVLHHDLEAVEAAGFWDLNFTTEALNKVLINNAVGRGEESKDMRDEVALIIVKAIVPVVEVFGQIDLFGSPEGGFRLLVHLPDLV